MDVKLQLPVKLCNQFGLLSFRLSNFRPGQVTSSWDKNASKMAKISS